MAIFSSKKNTKTPVAKTTKTTKKAVAVAAPKSINSSAHLLLRPRITEKAGIQGESLNVYTFEVAQNATKSHVADAIKELYKVTPLRVNIVRLPAKKVFVRGKFGVQSSVKKALVLLKKGDKIEFI